MEQKNEKLIWLVTGAAGFLGSHVCDELLERGESVRALVLHGDKSAKWIDERAEIVFGDLCDVQSLEDFFAVPTGYTTMLIHCASMVSVNPKFSQKLMDVNVGGTENLIDLCLKHPECQKMVYVSSTGAIPELPKGQLIKEVSQFTPVDDKVQRGCYSQSKAIATQRVLDAVAQKGLRACVVHPSGIMGPKDYAIGTTTGGMINIMKSGMSVGMKGTMNLCDVRDLAHGCILAAQRGRDGECYILANEELTIEECGKMLSQVYPCRPPKFYLPLGVASCMAKVAEGLASLTGKEPMLTSFSIYNLGRNNAYDYSKAQRELGYTTRPCSETIRDMVQWIVENIFSEKK